MRYIWTYSWEELLKFYKRKQSIYAERRRYDYEFLIDLAQAALGGKSKQEGEVSIDTGEGLDELTDEQEEALRRALGDDFDAVMGNT